MTKNVHTIIKNALEDANKGIIVKNPRKDKNKDKNHFTISRNNIDCGMRIIKDKKQPYVKIQKYTEGNQDDFFLVYNMIEKKHELVTPKQTYRIKITNAYNCKNKEKIWNIRKSIAFDIDNKFHPHNEEELEAIKDACVGLLDMIEECQTEFSNRRFFINIDGENEVSQDILSEYLRDKLSTNEQDLLLERGKIGITAPSGNGRGNYKARLWVSEEVLDKFPEEDISDSYWTAKWKPQSNTSNDANPCGYWVLSTNSLKSKFENYTECETFDVTLPTDGDNKQLFKQAKAGDKVLCYDIEESVQAIVALAEIVEAKGKKLVLKITKHVSPSISRDKLIQLEESEFFDSHPFTQTESADTPTLSPLNKEQFNLIIQIMAATKPHNRILFGAPGTGKSYNLEQDVRELYKEDANLIEACTERATFHPEYSYFDFVGSYKPVMESIENTPEQGDENETDGEKDKPKQGQIIYDFVPGPFARVLKEALQEIEKNGKKAQKYVLIIEEINRAKVAAVFGDIFQLLDRNEEGESEYGINPSKELRNYLGLKEGKKLKLPANMYIWATMNSADQGVYPMDTAFKRRWSFEYAELDDGATAMQNEPYHADWEMLRKHVNALLQKEGINEDKQMGPFFLKKSELREQNAFKNAIQNKVLMYLFEDAAKHKRKKIFKEPDKGMRYSAICKIFRTIYTKSKEEGSSEYITMADILEKLFDTK